MSIYIHIHIHTFVNKCLSVSSCSFVCVCMCRSDWQTVIVPSLHIYSNDCFCTFSHFSFASTFSQLHKRQIQRRTFHKKILCSTILLLIAILSSNLERSTDHKRGKGQDTGSERKGLQGAKERDLEAGGRDGVLHVFDRSVPWSRRTDGQTWSGYTDRETDTHQQTKTQTHVHALIHAHTHTHIHTHTHSARDRARESARAHERECDEDLCADPQDGTQNLFSIIMNE